jgi:hypothetical protein
VLPVTTLRERARKCAAPELMYTPLHSLHGPSRDVDGLGDAFRDVKLADNQLPLSTFQTSEMVKKIELQALAYGVPTSSIEESTTDPATERNDAAEAEGTVLTRDRKRKIYSSTARDKLLQHH